MKYLVASYLVSISSMTSYAAIKCSPRLSPPALCGSGRGSSYQDYSQIVSEVAKDSAPEEYLTIVDAQGVRTQKYQEAAGGGSVREVTHIEITPEITHQNMYGFGAAITESCLENMKGLSSAQREKFFQSIFDRQKGAGFSYLRVPIGANDFSLGDYTLNDTPKNRPDPELKSFNPQKLQAFIKFIQEAKKYNPDLKIMISPWTAPAWMKDTQALKGGQIKKEYHEAYSKYLLKAIQEFEKKGIAIDQMTILNEPLIGEAKTSWSFPQAYMSPEDQNDFIQNNLSPKLKGRNTKILVHDHNWDNAPAADPVMEGNKNNPAVQGMAYHCYGGHLGDLKNHLQKHSGTPAFNSECTSTLGRGGTDKDTYNWWQDTQSVDAVKAGISGSLGWNLCLDEKGGPQNNGCKDCRGLITIDSRTKSLSFNPEFKALEVTSKVISSGSRRVESTESNPQTTSLAFKNPDGSLSMVIRNKSNAAQSYKVRLEGCGSKQYRLPAGSTLSVRWFP